MTVYYKRLRDLREDHDLTQQTVAEMLNMKQFQDSRYERGMRDIPTDILIKLSFLYNVSVDYILEISNNPNIQK